MNAFFAVITLSFCAGATLAASPADRVVIAAMALSEQPNYSWSSAIEDSSGRYDLEGKTDSSGFTWLQMPLEKSLARRLGRESESQVEVYFRGKTASVLRTDAGWVSPTELPDRSPRELEPRQRQLQRGSASIGAFGAPGSQLVSAFPALRTDRPAAVFHSAQHAVSLPHEELAVIASSYREIFIEEDIAQGTLTEMGAALLLVREDSGSIVPLAAGGEFKLWLKHGQIVRYAVKVEGVVLLDRRKVPAHLASITVLRDNGRTRVLVPEEARFKLERMQAAGR